MTGLALLLAALILVAAYASAWDRQRQPRGPVCGVCDEEHPDDAAEIARLRSQLAWRGGWQ